MADRNAKKGFTDTLGEIRRGGDVPEDFIEVFRQVALARVRQHFGPRVRQAFASDGVAVSALVAAIEKLKNGDDPYDGTLRFFRSLRDIARNKAVDAGRKTQTAKRAQPKVAVPEGQEGQHESGIKQAERDHAYRTLATRALEIIEEIPDDYTRALVELRLLQGISGKNLREQLIDDFPDRTRGVRMIQKAYNAALDELKRRLTDEFPGETMDYFGDDDDDDDDAD